MGSIYQRKDGYWVFAYREDNKNRTKSLGKLGKLTNGKKREVLRRYEKLYEGNPTQRLNKSPIHLIHKLIEYIMEERNNKVKMNQLSQTTVGGDKKRLGYFKDFIFDKYGNISIDKIDDDVLNSYTDYCRDELGNNPTTIHNKHKAVQILIRYSLKKGYIQKSPYENVDIPKPIKRGKDRIPKRSEYKVIKKYLDGWADSYIEGNEKYHPINITSYFQIMLGMRIGEVLIMKWKKGKRDVGENHSFSYVYLNSNLTKLTVHFKRKKRVYPIDEIPMIPKILKKIKSDEKSRVYVLENNIKKKDGTPHSQSTSERYTDTYCSRPLKTMLRRLGIDDNYSTHSLRHSFVTDLIRKNHSLTKIGNLVGHSDIRMTELYGHLDTTDMRTLLSSV